MSVVGVFNIGGIYANLFYPHKDDLQKLSLLSEIESDILWSMAWTSNKQSHSINLNTVKILGESVPIQTISTRRVKLCPICLRSAFYCRSIWDLSLITTCPLHYCLLIDYCPQCSKDIKWSRPRIAICKCGFDSELAIKLIDVTLSRGYQPGIVIVDAGYGNNTSLLLKLENRQLKYLGGLAKNRKVILNVQDNIQQAIRLDELAQCLPQEAFTETKLKLYKPKTLWVATKEVEITGLSGK